MCFCPLNVEAYSSFVNSPTGIKLACPRVHLCCFFIPIDVIQVINFLNTTLGYLLRWLNNKWSIYTYIVNRRPNSWAPYTYIIRVVYKHINKWFSFQILIVIVIRKQHVNTKNNNYTLLYIAVQDLISSHIPFFPGGKNRISLVTRFQHICHSSWEICDRSRFLCSMKSHSSQVKKRVIIITKKN